MPWMLGRLIDRGEEDTWVVCLQGAEERLALPPPSRPLRPGDLVLLQGQPGAWRATCGPLVCGDHPELALPSDPLLEAAEVETLTLRLAVRGGWMVDEAGQALERGLHRGEDGALVPVLNAAGWRLGDLEDQPLRLRRVGEEEPVLVLLAEDVSAPEKVDPPPRPPLVLRSTPPATPQPAAPGPEPAPAPAPAPAPEPPDPQLSLLASLAPD